MGAYASWPLCSLAHHLVVEYSAYKAGINSSKEIYRLIGDDVIITDEKTAQNYQEIIQSLGIEINLGKTVISKQASDYSSAEVAKQLYLNGTCLSPVTPGFIRDIRKPYMLNTCMKVLMDRYDFLSNQAPADIIDLFYSKRKHRKHKKISWLLCSNPINGIIRPGNPGYDEFSPWTERDLRTIEDDYFVLISDGLSNKAIASIEESFSRMLSGPPSASGAETSAIPHVSRDIQEQLNDMLEEIDQLSMEDLVETVVTKYDFVPDPNAPYRDRKETRQKRLSSVIISLYDYDESEQLWNIGW
jgi:hypothetical protein